MSLTAWRVAAAVVSVAIVVVYAVGSGRWVTVGSSWYLSLEQPSWQPPPSVFGLAWTYNFVALSVVGVALAVIAPPGRAWAFLGSLAVTVALAILWAYLFYGSHALIAAALALTACAVLTLVPVALAFAQRWWLGAALIPYLLWLGIATSLAWGYAALER
jgi:tryptophan-rich sensory protein